MSPDSPLGAVIRSAIELAPGWRTPAVLASALADRYRVKVANDWSVIGLWRR